MRWILSSGVGTVIRRISHEYQNTNKTEAIIEVAKGDWSEMARRSRKTYQQVSGNLDIHTLESAYGSKDYRTEYVYNSNTNWLQSVQRSDGTWERHSHDYFGRIIALNAPFKDSSSVPVVSSAGRVQSFSYDQSPSAVASGAANAFAAVQLWDDTEFYHLPTEIIETLVNSSRVVSRSEIEYDKTSQLNSKTVLRAVRKDYASSSNFYTTTTKQYTNFLFNDEQLFAGLPISEELPDGTKTVWLHQPGHFAPGSTTNALTDFTPSNAHDVSNRYWRTVVFHGHSNSTPAISTFGSGPHNAIDPVFMEKDRSTVEVIIRGIQGKVIRREVHYFTGSTPSGANLASNYTLVDWTDYQYTPDYGYALLNARSSNTKPGTFEIENIYSNGRLHRTRNETGQLFEYQYDGLGRVIQETLLDNDSVAENSTLYWYNAAGDNIGRARIPGVAGSYPSGPDTLGISPRLVSRRDFDTGGRITRTEDENGVEKRYDYLKIGNFYRQMRREQDVPQTTNPSSTTVATHIKQFHLDGNIQSITGNAQVPQYFDYTVATCYEPNVCHEDSIKKKNQKGE